MSSQDGSKMSYIEGSRYLVFNIGDKSYCINFMQVKEIISITPYTPIPNLPKHYKGAINLRGQVLPVVDMGILLNSEEIKYNDRTCIIVVQHEKGEIGLIVDVVRDVLNETEDNRLIEIQKDAHEGNRTIKGIIKSEDTINYVLSLNELFN